MTSSLGLFLGTRISPREIGDVRVIVLPITFLAAPIYLDNAVSDQNRRFSWLQALVCVNPLIYVTEGFRAALTTSTHMQLYVIYPGSSASASFSSG